MKLGINLKIDVTKIDKDRLFKGKQGIYLDLTTFIDTEKVSKYGDNGAISQSKNKDEDIQLPILGNAKIFWKDEQQNTGYQNQQNPTYEQNNSTPPDDIPF